MTNEISRRRFLHGLGVLSGAAFVGTGCASRMRGGEAVDGWPASDAWEALDRRVGGRLIRPVSPLAACATAPGSAACSTALENLRNPFFLQDQPGATQSTGWLDAWRTEVSPYAVAAETAEDIAAAVDFAREHAVRIVVKGAGHDYLGRSNGSESLLVWTRRMRDVTVHDAFVPDGSPPGTPGATALSVGAGTRWLEAYQAATEAGLYVQGGGCTSVGASGGFILGGGFGSLSKRFGTGAGGVLELEVITADGRIRVANAYREPDLFWALRGGGGPTFGIVSRTTLLAHPIPRRIGIVAGAIAARSDEAYRKLIADFVAFYPDALNNERWGEQIRFHQSNVLEVMTTFVDIDRAMAEATWSPFLDGLRNDARFEVDVTFREMPFAHLWDAAWWEENDPNFVRLDRRPRRPGTHFWWAGNQGEVSAFWFAYESRWLPLAMFTESPGALARMLFDASRHHGIEMHINKGLAGEAEEARARDLQTSVHPGVFDAAALLIVASSQPAAHPGIEGHEPELAKGRVERESVGHAMRIIRQALPGQGTYANEADYFTEDWKQEFWGANYQRLLRIKRAVDPGNLFRVHHGVGSDE